MNEKLRQLLLRHEGKRLMPYVDTVGKVTIGVGRNLTDNGITECECEAMFFHDIDMAHSSLMIFFPDCDGWAEARENALIDMMFNMGARRFGGFKKMIAAVRIGDWAGAAREMLDSSWAIQLPTRVSELAKMVKTGR